MNNPDLRRPLPHPIADIGVNLMHRSFQQDREQVVERALSNRVTPLVITGTNLRSSGEAAHYAGRYPGKLYATAGVHPHDAKHCNEDILAQLKELAALPQVSGEASICGSWCG